ncbi:MAG: VanZ family protein [Bacteroidetes bacterium]|nr:VanZ family protein [Bacteroidota bacterium]
MIHALEFTWLVFLLFPVANRYSAAICLTLPFMLLDEWYQYILLYPEFNDYFDLNDILMDTYGCGLMMVLLMLLGVKNKPLPRFWKRFYLGMDQKRAVSA